MVLQLIHVIRKQVFGVTDQDGHKPSCTRAGRLKYSRFRKKRASVRRGFMLSETKMPISYTVTAQPICVTAQLFCAFVFAYEKAWLSHDMTQLCLQIVCFNQLI